MWAGRLRSPGAAADGRHLLADVVTSVGIAAGLFLAVFTGRWSSIRCWPPPLGSIAVVRHPDDLLSVSGLMDEAPEPACEPDQELVANSAAGAIEAHDLRTRHAGRLTSWNSTWWCRAA